MNRISFRLVFSNVLVTLLAGLTTYLVVRWLAPALFDEQRRRDMLAASGLGDHAGGEAAGAQIRAEFAAAVDRALVAGIIVGASTAVILGVFVALRLGRSLGRVSAATHRIAAGDYTVRVPVPAETELAHVATDVNTLGAALAEVEGRRVRLLGEVAHEMRTPLAVIGGYVEGMVDGLIKPDQAVLTQLASETRRLTRLSDDLSALSRAEEGRLDLTLSTVELRLIARDAAERLRPQLDDADLDLRLECGDQAIPVHADVDRIAQIVTNLIGNAIRATPAGGTITVRCGVHDKVATLSVSDTGIGLEPEQLERVFERFYRAAPGRPTTAAGSGIGLTIARSLARHHGGDLVAASPGPGLGATFTLTLPLDQNGV